MPKVGTVAVRELQEFFAAERRVMFFCFLTIKLPKVHSSIGPVDAFAWPSSQWPSMWPTSPKAWPTWWRTLWKSLKDSGCRLHRFRKLHGVQNINTNVFCAGGVFWVWPFSNLVVFESPGPGPLVLWALGPLVHWSFRFLVTLVP